MNHQAIYNKYPKVTSIIDEESGTIAYNIKGNKVVLDSKIIQTETNKLNSESGAVQYKINRVRGTKTTPIKYDTIGNQLDMLWHDIDNGKLGSNAKTSGFYTKNKAVKDAHKPSVYK